MRSKVPVCLAVVAQREATPAPPARRPWPALRATASCSCDRVMPVTLGARPPRPGRGRARPSRSRCRAPTCPARAAAWRRCGGASAPAASSRPSSAVEEIGAGVLPVAVEEQLVERAREVVVMRDVAARPASRVELLDPAQAHVDPPHHPVEGVVAASDLDVTADEVEEVVERGVLDGQQAVHVGLAGINVGPQEQLPMQGAIVEANGDRRPFAAGEGVVPAVRVDDAKTPDLDQTLEKARQQHRSAPSRCSSSIDSGRAGSGLTAIG